MGWNGSIKLILLSSRAVSYCQAARWNVAIGRTTAPTTGRTKLAARRCPRPAVATVWVFVGADRQFAVRGNRVVWLHPARPNACATWTTPQSAPADLSHHHPCNGPLLPWAPMRPPPGPIREVVDASRPTRCPAGSETEPLSIVRD